jgi:hypothetical protein
MRSETHAALWATPGAPTKEKIEGAIAAEAGSLTGQQQSGGGWAAGVQWLLDMQVPNSFVPAPVPGRSGLVLSYIVPEGVYNPKRSRSRIYDDALAVIA